MSATSNEIATICTEEAPGLLDRRAIARRFKHRWGAKPAVDRALEAAIEGVLGCLAPRSLTAVFAVELRGKAFHIGAVRLEAPFVVRRLKRLGPPQVALFVATLGAEIDAMIEATTARRAVAEAYFIDGVASAAVTSLADRVHQRLQQAAGAKRTFRLSPGVVARSGSGIAAEQEHWQLDGQQLFFQLLDPGRIGVSLDNAYWTMRPSKTVTALVPLCPADSSSGKQDAC